MIWQWLDPHNPTLRMIGLLCLVGLALGPTSGCKRTPEQWQPVASPPLKAAHAHNDYFHNRPLLDALDHRFMSVEADVHKGKDNLLVAHWWWQKDAARTLERLYLAPLWRRFLKNKGSIYKQKSQFYLLLDVKTDAVDTYQLLHQKLQKYKRMLTIFGPSGVRWGAVTAIISGNRPLQVMMKQKERLAAYDGRPSDLDKSYPASLVPLVSQKWSKMFSWDGDGEMPSDQWKRLRAYVTKAHKQGRMVRFWATPDAPGAARDALWKKLLQAGVDLINTDDLTGLQRFLLRQQQRPQQTRHLPR